MQRILLVSNRLPVTIERRKGRFHYRPSVGGLATGLASFYKTYDSLWLGWCGIPRDSFARDDIGTVQTTLREKYNSVPVFLSKKELKLFYQGFSNKTIWPLFHYFTDYVDYNFKFWQAYQEVNKRFCDVVMRVAKPNDLIWIHDYHLMLLPYMIRKEMPDAQIGFFLHIPFPSFEIFRLLPWRKQILEGLIGSDLIGFHTYDYVRHFLSSIRRIYGFEHNFNQIITENRMVKVDAFPMGIDFQRFARSHKNDTTKAQIEKLKSQMGERKIILSVDRLDYTKGILQRLEAFDHFLHKYPEYHEKVGMILIAVPSRTSVETYFRLKRNVDELVGQINGSHGIIGWTPVKYFYRSFPFEELTAFYNVADVALVTPIRDGMNLIAKEYMATKGNGPGVLILSEMAGAAHELGEAIIVNPNDKEMVADAIYEALNTPVEDICSRNKVMQKRLIRYNVVRWANDFIDRLENIKKMQRDRLSRQLTPEYQKNIVKQYHNAESRLLFLDYDGTLVSFKDKPEKAVPDEDVQNLIRTLSQNEKNEVVIISGRNRESLDTWFSGLDVALVAEHGVWIKEKGKKWRTIEPLRAEWKREIRPIIELFVDRTPGSFLEEKEYSLVWHYRKTVPDLAAVRVREIKDTLLQITENLNLAVLDGNKVIEIKNPGINKGRAVLRWLSKRDWDFVLCIGDDLTDEDMFSNLPPHAHSIKVGITLSHAKYSLDSVKEVLTFLEGLES